MAGQPQFFERQQQGNAQNRHAKKWSGRSRAAFLCVRAPRCGAAPLLPKLQVFLGQRFLANFVDTAAAADLAPAHHIGAVDQL